MKALEEKILSEGEIYPGNILKVNHFLNHRIDSLFMMEMGGEIARLFKDDNITKVLTVEASGIAIGLAAAAKLGIPLVYAKKSSSINISNDVYTSTVYSYTHQKNYTISVERQFISEGERILIVDDFLAIGNAIRGLIDIISQAGAQAVGISAAIEKGFQGGGDKLREAGYKVESLAVIDKFEDGKVIFRT